MKKTAVWMMILVLTLSTGAMAMAEGTLSASGQLEAAITTPITAPYDSRILQSDIQSGDTLDAGDVMFGLQTTKVYAPVDGTVTGLLIEEGDIMADILSYYEAAMYIQPTSKYTISATTSGAYNDDDNKYIYVGETVYLTSTSTTDRTGTGLVTSVDGSNYTVEVWTDDLNLDENCYISRSDDYDYDKGRIGTGKTARSGLFAISAEGSVLAIHVEEGETVQRGDLLFEVVHGDLRANRRESSTLYADDACIVATVNCTTGDVVSEGQLLATVFPIGALEAIVEIDETELTDIKVGDQVIIELDGDAQERVYDGVVKSIAAIANTSGSNVTYDAAIAFINDDFVRQGMSVTVTLK